MFSVYLFYTDTQSIKLINVLSNYHISIYMIFLPSYRDSLILMVVRLGLEQLHIIRSDQMNERSDATDQILSRDLFEQILGSDLIYSKRSDLGTALFKYHKLLISFQVLQYRGTLRSSRPILQGYPWVLICYTIRVPLGHQGLYYKKKVKLENFGKPIIDSDSSTPTMFSQVL